MKQSKELKLDINWKIHKIENWTKIDNIGKLAKIDKLDKNWKMEKNPTENWTKTWKIDEGKRQKLKNPQDRKFDKNWKMGEKENENWTKNWKIDENKIGQTLKNPQNRKLTILENGSLNRILEVNNSRSIITCNILPAELVDVCVWQ